MRMFVCDNCGVRSSDSAIITMIRKVVDRGYFDRKYMEEAIEDLKETEDITYIRCHNCKGGFFRLLGDSEKFSFS